MITKILKEAKWVKKTQVENSLERALALIDHEDKEFVYKLKAKIAEKFGEVGKHLRAVLKPASKGQRKGCSEGDFGSLRKEPYRIRPLKTRNRRWLRDCHRR